MFKIIIHAFQMDINCILMKYYLNIMDINCILIRDRPIYRFTDIFPDI